MTVVLADDSVYYYFISPRFWAAVARTHARCQVGYSANTLVAVLVLP